MFFDLDSNKSLISCMENIIEDFELYQKISLNGWSFTKEQLSISAAEQYNYLISQL